jgi:ATP phosphoribosyltransferase
MFIRMALPKGHLWDDTEDLLGEAGYTPNLRDPRSYLVKTNDPEIQMRIHRAQNIGLLVEEGKYDLGITGLDWVVEPKADVELLMDLEYGRVDVVSAIPQRYGIKPSDETSGDEIFQKFLKAIKAEGKTRVIVASEYENLTIALCEEKFAGFPYRFIRSYGATETFIEVADMIVDCTETGRTLRENGWEVVHKLFDSTARLVACKESLKDAEKRTKMEGFMTIIGGALEAKGLKLLKMNVSESDFEEVIAVLPAMKSPTISQLYGGNGGYAVEVAVREDQVVQLIPVLKRKGATDIIELDVKKAIR